MRRNFTLALSACFVLAKASASQWGPVFPSHRFPTDRSFHLNSTFNYGAESTYFDEDASRQDLGGTLTRLRLVINPEYQPNRDLSIGAYLNFDSLKLNIDGLQLTKAGFSDQFIFGEYRLLDDPGFSMGFATVFKIPLYSVPGSVQPTDEPFLLLGDGQIDSTLLYCTEYWATTHLKFIGDFGVTYRTDDHASEIPFQLGGAYVTPKYTIELALLGNLSFRNDKTGDSATTADIQTLTQNTKYVYSINPQTINIELKGEYAFNTSWAMLATFSNSIWANNAPYFLNFGVGVSYRYFDPAEKGRSAREVGIETDDSSKEFEGEVQEGRDEKDSVDRLKEETNDESED
jgi:hypothetical protein